MKLEIDKIKANTSSGTGFLISKTVKELKFLTYPPAASVERASSVAVPCE